MKSASRVVYKGRNFGTTSCKVERGYKPDLTYRLPPQRVGLLLESKIDSSKKCKRSFTHSTGNKVVTRTGNRFDAIAAVNI
jgi:hypothetical protein